MLTLASFDKLTSIQQNVFINCSVLASVSIPSVITVGVGAFIGCGFTSISLPKTEYISRYAFSFCTNLSTAYLPNVKSLGSSVFAYCYNLTRLYLTGGNMSNVPTMDKSVFNSTPIGGYSASAGQYGSVYVPASLYSAFLTATNWSSIADRIVSVE